MSRWGLVALVACAGGEGQGDGGSAAACLGGGEWTFEYTRDPASSAMCPELAPEDGPAVASDDYEESCDPSCTCAEEYVGCDYTLSEVCDRGGDTSNIDCALSLGIESITGTCTVVVSAGPVEVACEYAVVGSRL
ncbi:MAG: hypothetical protein ABMA64_17905 [Myxococcota bacterium]